MSKPTFTPRQAVALKYEGKGAPKVIAKGRHRIAEEIIERARAAGVPIHEDAELVALLSQVELNQEIPDNLYQAVAAVLAFLYRLSDQDEQGHHHLIKK